MLEVDDPLLEFPSRLLRQLFRGRHAPPRFADARERRRRDELAQEVLTRLAGGAKYKCRFQSFRLSAVVRKDFAQA